MDPSRDMFSKWQEANAALEALKARGAMPAEAWSPETRSMSQGSGMNVGEGVEYLVGDKWWGQDAWDDPSFQQSVVDPYRQSLERKAQLAYSKELADLMQRAEMAKFDYDDYLARQDEIKATATMGSRTNRPSDGTNRRMMGNRR